MSKSVRDTEVIGIASNSARSGSGTGVRGRWKRMLALGSRPARVGIVTSMRIGCEGCRPQCAAAHL